MRVDFGRTSTGQVWITFLSDQNVALARLEMSVVQARQMSEMLTKIADDVTEIPCIPDTFEVVDRTTKTDWMAAAARTIVELYKQIDLVSAAIKAHYDARKVEIDLVSAAIKAHYDARKVDSQEPSEAAKDGM